MGQNRARPGPVQRFMHVLGWITRLGGNGAYEAAEDDGQSKVARGVESTDIARTAPLASVFLFILTSA